MNPEGRSVRRSGRNRDQAVALGLGFFFSREAFQSLWRALSSSKETPPWSSPEFHRSIRIFRRSRSGPLGRNRPRNFLRTLSRGSAGGRGASGSLGFGASATAAA